MPRLCTRLAPSLLLLVVLVWSAPAHAQLPVIDVGDIAQNTITAIESTLTTIETVLIEANQILDLTNVNGVAVQGGIVQDMQLLGQLVTQTQGLSYDISSIQAQVDALFGLPTAPTTTSALRQRLLQIRQLKYEVYSYAIRVQTLLRTALRTVDHLQALLATLTKLIGNLQGHETHVQTTTVASKHLANLDVQIASFHRAQAVDRLEEVLILESLRRINNHVYERND
jgi:conjugal transfer/entry exclusion protein